MRSRLLISGMMTFALGLLLYILEIPLFFAWSIPFMIGGMIMALVSPFLRESEGPLQPPEGYTFCVFCSNLVKLGEERCNHCGGLQPKR